MLLIVTHQSAPVHHRVFEHFAPLGEYIIKSLKKYTIVAL